MQQNASKQVVFDADFTKQTASFIFYQKKIVVTSHVQSQKVTAPVYVHFKRPYGRHHLSSCDKESRFGSPRISHNRLECSQLDALNPQHYLLC